jgi:hypothetical protein
LVKEFKDTTPIILTFKNPNLKDYHWADIRTIIKKPDFDINQNKEMKLKDLINMGIV